MIPPSVSTPPALLSPSSVPAAPFPHSNFIFLTPLAPLRSRALSHTNTRIIMLPPTLPPPETHARTHARTHTRARAHNLSTHVCPSCRHPNPLPQTWYSVISSPSRCTSPAEIASVAPCTSSLFCGPRKDCTFSSTTSAATGRECGRAPRARLSQCKAANVTRAPRSRAAHAHTRTRAPSREGLPRASPCRKNGSSAILCDILEVKSACGRESGQCTCTTSWRAPCHRQTS